MGFLIGIGIGVWYWVAIESGGQRKGREWATHTWVVEVRGASVSMGLKTKGFD